MVTADKSECELVLNVAPDADPFHVPLEVTAAVANDTGPVAAETKREAVK